MIPIDKQAHFWWGMAISAVTYPLGIGTAIFFAAALGAAKELWDRAGHGTPDAKDWAVTALGGVVGAGLCWAVREVAPCM